MNNPWLDVPATDYLGHMGSPGVDQLAVLSRIFRQVLEEVRPVDVLLLGCSTGNGLAHVDPGVTRTVVGVDINPSYLTRLAQDYPSPGFTLELVCADVSTLTLPSQRFDLVHCALILEYVDWEQLITEVSRVLRSGGSLSVVLQRPSVVSPAVTMSDYPSLLGLERVFRFVEPPALQAHAHASGLELHAQRSEPLPSGKAFQVMDLRKAGARERQ